MEAQKSQQIKDNLASALELLIINEEIQREIKANKEQKKLVMQEFYAEYEEMILQKTFLYDANFDTIKQCIKEINELLI